VKKEEGVAETQIVRSPKRAVKEIRGCKSWTGVSSRSPLIGKLYSELTFSHINYELMIGAVCAIGLIILYLSVASLFISVILYLGSELTASITIKLSKRRVLKVVSKRTAASLTPALVSFYINVITLSLIPLNN